MSGKVAGLRQNRVAFGIDGHMPSGVKSFSDSFRGTEMIIRELIVMPTDGPVCLGA